ncbi:Pectinesterase inhibitor domain containing protein [Parasponia andersonii]|uniref:Pectinesterase inhibitor domain containing protein n=1 Tax=Parasponia andersonii TaxID=3476 RepID=A0A2P5ADN3_PARAD|nr:Pectinesterase inhibitor domain containing protein [Parasponia andersonii]
MADLIISLLPIFLVFLFTSTTVEPAFHRRSRTRAYVEVSCQVTEYPDLCIRCLTAYVHSSNATVLSPHQLVQYALLASQHRAQYTRAYLLKLSKELTDNKGQEYQAVKDCLEQIDLSVDQLSMSIKEFRQLGREATLSRDDQFWHIRNVETWVGSALTDATTCLDEFPGQRMSKLKATVKAKVLNVAQVTENALALFHRFAARY